MVPRWADQGKTPSIISLPDRQGQLDTASRRCQSSRKTLLAIIGVGIDPPLFTFQIQQCSTHWLAMYPMQDRFMDTNRGKRRNRREHRSFFEKLQNTSQPARIFNMGLGA